MSNPVTGATAAVKRNVDTKIMVSTAAGVALFGLVTFLAVKSGIKPLRDVAAVAKGGK